MLRRILVVIAATLPTAIAADVHIVEEIVAKVNGDIITRGDIHRQEVLLQQELRSQGLNGQRLTDAVNQQQKDALRDQIDTLLLVQRGKDLNLKVDPDVNRQLAEIQVQSKLTDVDQFHNYVREQTGMSFEDYKQHLTDMLLTRRVISEEISSRMSVPEADLRKYYDEHQKEFVREEQVFLSQIVISTEGKNPQQVAAAEKKAADLVARARKGEKFSDLARDNSDDTETARNGGELGASKRGMLRKEIEDIVFSQKKGYVTDPIRTPGRLVILKVDERFEAGQASFEEVRDEITQRVLGPQMEPKVRDYLTRLRKDAFLQIKDGYADSGAAPGKDTRWKDAIELKPETTTKEEVAARHRKRFLGIIPHGSKGKPAGDEAKPATDTAPKQ